MFILNLLLIDEARGSSYGGWCDNDITEKQIYCTTGRMVEESKDKIQQVVDYMPNLSNFIEHYSNHSQNMENAYMHMHMRISSIEWKLHRMFNLVHMVLEKINCGETNKV